MPLADRLNNPPPRVSGFGCSVCLLLRDLPKDESAALQTMLDDFAKWSAADIFEAVKDEGHVIGRQTVSKHRAGKCAALKNVRPAA